MTNKMAVIGETGNNAEVYGGTIQQSINIIIHKPDWLESVSEPGSVLHQF